MSSPGNSCTHHLESELSRVLVWGMAVGGRRNTLEMGNGGGCGRGWDVDSAAARSSALIGRSIAGASATLDSSISILD